MNQPNESGSVYPAPAASNFPLHSNYSLAEITGHVPGDAYAGGNATQTLPAPHVAPSTVGTQGGALPQAGKHVAQQWSRIPKELQALPYLIAGPNEKGELKVPLSISADGAIYPGSSTNQATWLTFERACDVASVLGYGIGFVLSEHDPYAVVDFDVKGFHNEPDPAKHTTLDAMNRQWRIAQWLDSYVEYSRSGIGLHAIVRAQPTAGAKHDGVEVYSRQRFMVATGNVRIDKPIEERQGELDWLIHQIRMFQSAKYKIVELIEVDQKEDDEVILKRASSAANHIKFDDLWKGEWQKPPYTFPSQSEADLALLSMLCFYSPSNEQCRRLFRQSALGNRAKAQKDDRYLDLSVQLIRSRMADEESQAAKVQLDRRERIKAIGDGTISPTPMPVLSVTQMKEQFVFILAKSNVALLDNPSFMAPLADFRNLSAASMTEVAVVDANGNRKRQMKASIDLWLKTPERLMAQTVTFDPRFGNFCADPHGALSLNLYRPRPHVAPPDWQARVRPLLAHVEYLIPVSTERERFLSWLAHIEQQPGKLTHSGYLMIAPKQGVGRNWLASVLACVWRGHVALDFDLNHVLNSGFNGRLSRKFLAVVDEINEGVQTEQWVHSEKLKSMVTTEVRNINPKFGFEHTEHNCCRWLLFSNFESAIPLKDGDRRWNVIRNPDDPKDKSYYQALYDLIDDPSFIAAVREWFRQRDLSKFNPGDRPVMNDAKAAVVAATLSEATERAMELVKSWPRDCITAEDFCEELYGKNDDKIHGKLKYRAKEAGIVKWQGQGTGRIRVLGRQHSIWILRNQSHWAHAGSSALVAELTRLIQP